MEDKQNNIYPIFDRMMTREDKERLLKQRSVMVWFTGLSGSGKSTVAIALERELHKCGLLCRILDGDNIRSGINNNLGFSAEDRVENIRRIAEVSKLFIDTGVITIAAFISPNNDLREGELPGNICQHSDRRVRAARCQRVVCEGTPGRDQGFHGCFRSFRSTRTS